MDDREAAIATAMNESDIDGYGSEGAGWDFSKFADILEELGWKWVGADA